MEHEKAEPDGARRRRQLQHITAEEPPEKNAPARRTLAADKSRNAHGTADTAHQLVNLANEDDNDVYETHAMLERPLKRAHRAVIPPAR